MEHLMGEGTGCMTRFAFAICLSCIVCKKLAQSKKCSVYLNQLVAVWCAGFWHVKYCLTFKRFMFSLDNYFKKTDTDKKRDILKKWMRNYVDPNLNNFTENCHKKLMKILKHWKAKLSILVLGFKFKMFF